MSDLISRQEVLEALTVTEEMNTADLLWLLTTRINDLPTVDPVVRCKDCEEWMDDWEDRSEERHYCAMVDGTTEGTWFCADGVKKA